MRAVCSLSSAFPFSISIYIRENFEKAPDDARTSEDRFYLEILPLGTHSHFFFFIPLYSFGKFLIRDAHLGHIAAAAAAAAAAAIRPYE
jgi:hypothetical protein